MSVVQAQENKLMRRVAGTHNYRLDGMGDILSRCRDRSVLDLGCQFGQVGQDFVNNGCSVLHGCDENAFYIEVASHWFHNYRQIESKFVVADLTRGPAALRDAFGDRKYDIVLMLATFHKIKRGMDVRLLADLMRDIGARTDKFFCWRATSDKLAENDEEMHNLDKWLGLKRVHTSLLSEELKHCAIWVRH